MNNNNKTSKRILLILVILLFIYLIWFFTNKKQNKGNSNEVDKGNQENKDNSNQGDKVNQGSDKGNQGNENNSNQGDKGNQVNENNRNQGDKGNDLPKNDLLLPYQYFNSNMVLVSYEKNFGGLSGTSVSQGQIFNFSSDLKPRGVKKFEEYGLKNDGSYYSRIFYFSFSNASGKAVLDNKEYIFPSYSFDSFSPFAFSDLYDHSNKLLYIGFLRYIEYFKDVNNVVVRNSLRYKMIPANNLYLKLESDDTLAFYEYISEGIFRILCTFKMPDKEKLQTLYKFLGYFTINNLK